MLQACRHVGNTELLLLVVTPFSVGVVYAVSYGYSRQYCMDTVGGFVCIQQAVWYAYSRQHLA